MASLRSRAQAAAMDRLTGALYARGYTPKSLAEGQRDTIWWTWARVQAAMNVRPLLRAWAVAWTSAGYAELVPTDVPRAGRSRVTVKTVATAVSPGTERAQYLRLPNAQVGLLGSPGYSAAGTVLQAGPGVEFAPGDLVAVTGAKHASVVTAKAADVHAVPAGVDPRDASLVMLGVICGQGVELAAPIEGEEFAVIGAGAIGALTLRIAALRGTPRAVVATSRRREEAARRAGAAEFLATGEDDEAIDSLALPLVFEATGSPAAINVAIRAAAPGGRIILIGSPRGVTRDLDVAALQRKEIEIVGAHVDTIDIGADDGGAARRRQMAGRFLEHLGRGEIDVADLRDPPVDPREAARFYRDLADGKDDLVGAHFDWTLLPDSLRVGRAHLLAPPNFTGRGMEAKWPLRPPRGAAALQLEDPFAGASGHLRLGFLGCGDIAVQNAGGIAAAPNAEVVAAFDPDQRLAQSLAAAHEATPCRTAEELVGHPDVDAVVIAVPHHLHAPLALLAIEAGKHVVVEKPLANTLEDGRRIIAAGADAGVLVSVCFPQRYDAVARRARRLIEQGALGRFEGSLTRLFLDKSPAYWRGGFSGRSHSDWRRLRATAGGGVLIMNLSHHIDLVRHLTGAEAETIHARTTSEEGWEIEDSLTVAIEYEGGGLGTLIGSSAVRGSTEEEMTVWGDDGRIVVAPKPAVYSLRPLAGLRGNRWHSFGPSPATKIRAVYFSRLASALSEGRTPEVTGEDGLAVQAFIEAAYRSAETGEPVRPSALIEGAEREGQPA